MQLFTRRVQLTGPPAAVMAYATDMRAHASSISGREIALWSGVFGGPVGTMFYTTRVEGVADMAAMMAKIGESEEYHTKLAAGREFVAGPSEDSLGVPIWGELGENPPVGAYAQVVSAVIANGAYEEAFAWGADMAEYAAGLTGVPEMFLASQFGAFGAVSWIAVAPDAATVDRANAALNGDAEYMKRLGAAKDLFLPGSGMQGLVTRVA